VAVSWLEAEDLILARLAEFKLDGVEIRSMDEIKSIEDLSQYSSTIYVGYGGFTPFDSSGKGQLQKIRQKWVVVTAVRDVSDILSGKNPRSVASPIMDSVTTALLGYKLATGFGEMKLLPDDGQFYDKGFAFFSLGFETLISIKGSFN
jgi:hypothetical protein